MAGMSISALLVIAVLQVSCAGTSKCNWRYFQHYEQKNCEPVIGKNGCPEKFQCKSISDETRARCIHNGKSYKIGQPIQETSACSSCSCVLSRSGEAIIECASVDCPSWEAENKACYMGYEPGECCPKEICPSKGKELSKTCNHNSKTYKIGEYIQTEDPCQSCICTKEWVDENGPGCSKVNCLTGIDASKIRRGCLPIYSKRTCCSTEIYCGGIDGATPITIPGEDKDHFCHYQGKYYARGSTAYLASNEYQCITCRCNVPPDFTCLRKTCPPKPKENCKTVYGPCCPKYECP